MEKSLSGGMFVAVYVDPITRTRPEGVARLKGQRLTKDGEYEDWFVRFIGDGSDVRRTIHAPTATNVVVIDAIANMLHAMSLQWASNTDLREILEDHFITKSGDRS